MKHHRITSRQAQYSRRLPLPTWPAFGWAIFLSEIALTEIMLNMSEVDDEVVDHLIGRLLDEAKDMFDDDATSEEVLVAFGRATQALALLINKTGTVH